MAIKVRVTADNGIITEYHRVALVSIDVNQQNTILVHSYLSEAGRQVEKDYESGLYSDLEEGMMKFPYVAAEYIAADYNPDMTVSAAYTYLKSLPKFAGAIDI